MKTSAALLISLLLSIPVLAEPIPGDVNGNGQCDISDAVSVINYIFMGVPLPPPAPLLVDVQFRAPGTIGQPTIADVFMLWRRNPDDSLVLVESVTPADSLLAGEYVQFTLDVPRTESWYTYFLWYAHDTWIAVGDSMTIKSAEYQTK